MKLKAILSIFLFIALLSSAYAETDLWTKSYPASEFGTNGSYVIMLGQDGSVAVMDGYQDTRNVRWYGRDGSLIKQFNLVSTDAIGFIFVSQHEVVIGGGKNPDYYTDLFQLDADNNLEYRRINGVGVGIFPSFAGFQYPYMLERTINEDNSIDLKLIDLTNENYLNIVGDAEIGIHGKNLKVRWKTLANAQYKIQTSTDMETWADYTDVIDGTGATKVVMISLNDSDDRLFARVLKL